MRDRSIAIIMNPASSRGETQKRQNQLRELMDVAVAEAASKGHTVSYQIIQTTVPGRAIQTGEAVEGSGAFLACKAVIDGANVVAAAGGDGTVGEVANGLIGTGVPLGVLPMGTGNDFARTIRLGTNLELAVQALVFGETRSVDLGKGPGGYFINIAGCGFDAEVAHRINHYFRRLRGTMAYLAAVIQTLASMKPTPITLTIDDVQRTETVMLCAIANAKTYGGGMRIAPNADISDGLFDIVLVGNIGKIEFLRAFPQVFKGTHTDHPKVTVLQGKHVRIESEHAMPVLADGEEIGSVPVEFQIVEGALKVLVPMKPA